MRVKRLGLHGDSWRSSASSGSAYALDVNKKIAAPAQLLVVWSTISEFCSIKDWHPGGRRLQGEQGGG